MNDPRVPRDGHFDAPKVPLSRPNEQNMVRSTSITRLLALWTLLAVFFTPAMVTCADDDDDGGGDDGLDDGAAPEAEGLGIRLFNLQDVGIPVNVLDQVLIGKRLSLSDLVGSGRKLGAGAFGAVRQVHIAQLQAKHGRAFAAKVASNVGSSALSRLRSQFIRTGVSEQDPKFDAKFRVWATADDDLRAGLLESAVMEGQEAWAGIKAEIVALKALSGGPFLMKLWGDIETAVLAKEALIQNQKSETVILPVCDKGDLRKWLSPSPAAAADDRRLRERDDDDEEEVTATPKKAADGRGRSASAPARVPKTDAEPDTPGPSDKDITRMFARLVVAVAYMHQKGYIHSDLKPENVLLCGDGLPRVIDFGSTRTVKQYRQMTSQGEVPAGTRGYMPPEAVSMRQYKRAPRYGGDSYALGIILWQFYQTLLENRGEYSFRTPQEHTDRTGEHKKLIFKDQNILRFRNMPRQRRAAILALVNKLAAHSMAGRPSSPGELLEVVFTSEYVTGSGHASFNVDARVDIRIMKGLRFASADGTPFTGHRLELEKAKVMVERINDEGIEAAAADNEVVDVVTNGYLGLVTAWKRGAREPTTPASSSVLDYQCGQKFYIRFSTANAVAQKCHDKTYDPETTRIFFKLSSKSKLEFKQGLFGNKPITVGDAPACDFIKDALANWRSKSASLGEAAKPPPDKLSFVIPTSTSLPPGKYYLYGKIKVFKGKAQVKAAGSEHGKGTDEGYTTEVPFVVSGGCARRKRRRMRV